MESVRRGNGLVAARVLLSNLPTSLSTDFLPSSGAATFANIPAKPSAPYRGFCEETELLMTSESNRGSCHIRRNSAMMS